MRKNWPLLLLIAALLPPAAEAVEPVSVSARFESEHRSQGLTASSWEVRPSAELRTGYDGNPGRSRASDGSAMLGIRGAVDANRQWGTSQIGVTAGIEQEWYPSTPDEDQFAVRAALRGSTYAGNQVQIRGSIGIARDGDEISASDNGIETGGVLDRYRGAPQYVRVPLEAGISQDIGRYFWDISLRSTYSTYDALTTESGITVRQGFRTGWESAAEARAGYRIAEGYALFARAEANRKRFEDISADNDGYRFSLGTQFELTRILTGEVTAGWASQSYAVSGQSNSAFTYGGKLNWYASPLISLTLNANRDFQADQTIDALGVTTTIPVVRDTVALRADVEAMRYWLLFGEVSYSRQESDDGLRNNSLTELRLGSIYVLTRHLRFDAQYEYTLAQTATTGDIPRNALTLALTAAY
jgi:hypothetical protein